MKKVKLICVILVMAFLCVILLSACGQINTQSGGGAFASSADDTVYKLSFTSWNPESGGMAICEKAGMEYIEKESNGRIKFDGYWGGTLLGAGDTFSGVADGLADISIYIVSLSSGVQPVAELLAQRYFQEMPDMDGIKDIYRTVLVEIPEIQQELAAQNLYFLDVIGPPGSIMSFTDDSALNVNVPEDLKGMVVYSAGYYLQALQTIGVAGMNMAPPDWYTNLERGIVDCMIMNWPGHKDFGLTDLTKSYVTFGNGGTLSAGAQGFIINLDTWNSLPADLQQIVVDGFRYANDLLVERDLAFQYEVRDSELIDAGKIAQHIKQENMQPWYDLSMIAIDFWIKDVTDKGYDGEKIFNTYSKIISDYIAGN